VVAARAAAATIDAIAMTQQGDVDGADALLYANEQALDRSLVGTGGEGKNGVTQQQRDGVVRQREELSRLRGEVRNAAPKASAEDRWGASDGYRRVAKEANAAAVQVLQAHQ
jgi:hypothetical protein